MEEQNKKLASGFEAAIRKLETLKTPFCLQHRVPDWLVTTLSSAQAVCQSIQAHRDLA